MKKIVLLIFMPIMLLMSGCDSSSNKYTIEGIKFTEEEIANVTQNGLSLDTVKNMIQNDRKEGKSDQEIKKDVLNYKHNIATLGEMFAFIDETSQQDKNRFYESCYNEFSNNIKTFSDREVITKYCDCFADCLIDNVKWHNNMPITLSEEDEKDKGKVDVAWVELTKKCKSVCLNKTKSQINKK